MLWGRTAKSISGSPFVTSTQNHDSWIIEFLNVTLSFVRRQVNPQSGFVSQDSGSVTVIFEDAQTQFRETYRVLGQAHFTYTADMSPDGGRTWGPVLVEMTMMRVE